MNLLVKLNHLPEKELVLTEILCNIIKEKLPQSSSKLAYGVPFFYLRKRVCFVWPTSIPRSGVDSGVLLGFWKGYLINYKKDNFRGKLNKSVRFIVYHDPSEIDIECIHHWLDEAVIIDQLNSTT